MIDFIQVIQEIKNTSWLEWAAVLSGILYVVLITFKNILAWIMAFLSSGIYVYLCYTSQYYLETGLQLFYVAMAIYGWVSWNNVPEKSPFINHWSIKYHLLNITLSGMAVLILGYIFQNYTDQELPYLDAFTTVFSIVATFMVAKRVLENWIYWIIIDIVSVQLYAYKGFNLTVLLYLIFVIISIIGFLRWRKMYKLQTS